MPRNFSRILLVSLAFLFTTGFVTTGKSCRKDPTPVVISATIGPETQKLIDEQNKQIADLKAKEVENAKLKDQIAGSAYGITIGTDHITDDSKGKKIVEAENGLIKKIVGKPSPETRAEADARTISILNDDLVKQKELYGKAVEKIDTINAQIAAKDEEIKKRDQALIDQKKNSDEEIKQTAAKMQIVIDERDSTIKARNATIQDMKDKQAAKERRMWINVLRFGGFGIILAGVLALAVSQGKALIPGGILILSGSLIIGIGLAIDIVTSQVWFPYAAFGVGVLVIIGVGWCLWHFIKEHILGKKAAAVINDMKTEAQTLSERGITDGDSTLSKLQEHVHYRFGDAKSFWNKRLHGEFVADGLDEKTTTPSLSATK
jgi:hypothetical protein